MSEEMFFAGQLDADAGDSATRLIYAGWLAERGDVRAHGYAWMAEQGKRPSLTSVAKVWRFYAEWVSSRASGNNQHPADCDVLGQDLFDSLPPGPKSRGFAYPTRQAAEDALCAALARCGPVERSRPVPAVDV